jgi:hypothetical protein
MSTDFNDRIARLNAKNGVQPTETPSPEPGRDGDGQNAPWDKSPRGSLVKYIAIGLLILVVMPVGAAMATLFLGQHKQQLANVSTVVKDSTAGLSLLKTMYIDGDEEVRDARKGLMSLGWRAAAGKLSQEERDFYGTPQGEMALGFQMRKAYNIDQFEEKAAKHFGK